MSIFFAIVTFVYQINYNLRLQVRHPSDNYGGDRMRENPAGEVHVCSSITSSSESEQHDSDEGNIIKKLMSFQMAFFAFCCSCFY